MLLELLWKHSFARSPPTAEVRPLFICYFWCLFVFVGLGFKLQSWRPPPEENPTNGLRMIYTPTTLAMDPDLQFKEQLDFLADPFTFSREQLSVFVRTLNEKVDGSTNETQESEDDEDE